MEMRYKEVERARNIFERYVRCIPTVKSYVRYAKFEMRNGDVVRSRRCYERAVEELGEDAQTVRVPCSLGPRSDGFISGLHWLVAYSLDDHRL